MVTLESEVRVMVTPEVRLQGYCHARDEVRVLVTVESEARGLVTPAVRSGLWSHPEMRCRVTVTAQTGSGYGYKR
jgi:hypothetical protein